MLHIVLHYLMLGLEYILLLIYMTLLHYLLLNIHIHTHSLLLLVELYLLVSNLLLKLLFHLCLISFVPLRNSVISLSTYLDAFSSAVNPFRLSQEPASSNASAHRRIKLFVLFILVVFYIYDAAVLKSLRLPVINYREASRSPLRRYSPRERV